MLQGPWSFFVHWKVRTVETSWLVEGIKASESGRHCLIMAGSDSCRYCNQDDGPIRGNWSMEEALDGEAFLRVAEATVLLVIDQLGAKEHAPLTSGWGVAPTRSWSCPCQMPNDDRNRWKEEAGGVREVGEQYNEGEKERKWLLNGGHGVTVTAGCRCTTEPMMHWLLRHQ